jgi:hypothetical protein
MNGLWPTGPEASRTARGAVRGVAAALNEPQRRLALAATGSRSPRSRSPAPDCDYYRRLTEGKNKTEAIRALKRKIAIGLYQFLKQDQQSFDSTA